MTRRRVVLTIIALALSATPAQAAPVKFMSAAGQVTIREDPFLAPAVAEPPLASAAGLSRRATVSDRNMVTELTRFYHHRQITRQAWRHYERAWATALGTEQRLSGTPAIELESVIQNLHAIAAAGLLNPTRLPVLFETLGRNVQWWGNGALLNSGDRVQFSGSQLVWEYYAGQGIELQELGSWGQADWMYQAGPKYWPRLLKLVDELVPMAAVRGGNLAWEYYFNFDGGTPPWTSAMSQGTALQALTEAYEASGRSRYRRLASRAVRILGVAPPAGVAVRTGLGMRYLIYSFAPDAAVINGFLQTLIGLYDYAHAFGDRLGRRLFALGDAEARAEVPQYDTAAWSLYQPGQESSLDYHNLVTLFLHQLCDRTHARVYCVTAAHFDAYLKTPPVLALLTHRATVGNPLQVYFRVSKISRVGITIKRWDQTVFLTSATFPYGVSAFSVPAFARTGRYSVTLDATDLAGNYNAHTDTVQVGG